MFFAIFDGYFDKSICNFKTYGFQVIDVHFINWIKRNCSFCYRGLCTSGFMNTMYFDILLNFWRRFNIHIGLLSQQTYRNLLARTNLRYFKVIQIRNDDEYSMNYLKFSTSWIENTATKQIESIVLRLVSKWKRKINIKEEQSWLELK